MSLLMQIDEHLRQTKMPESRFGREAIGDPNFVADLRDGRRPRPTTARRVLAHIARQVQRATKQRPVP
jgi:hypothetical protein